MSPPDTPRNPARDEARRFPSWTRLCPLLVFAIAWWVCRRMDPASLPLQADNQISFYISERVAAGVPPHVSVVDPENALGSLIAGAAIALGRHFEIADLIASRLASISVAAAGAAAVWRLGERLARSPWGGHFAAAVLMSFELFWMQAAMGDRPKVFATSFLALALAAFAAGRDRRAGLWSAASFFCWQPVGAGFLGIVAACLLSREGRRRLLAVSFGFFAASAAYEAWFAWQGALAEQLQQAFVIAFRGRYFLWKIYDNASIALAVLALGAVAILLLQSSRAFVAGDVRQQRPRSLRTVAPLIGLLVVAALGMHLVSNDQPAEQVSPATRPSAAVPDVAAPDAATTTPSPEPVEEKTWDDSTRPGLFDGLRFVAALGTPPRVPPPPPFALVFLLSVVVLLASFAGGPRRALRAMIAHPAASATAIAGGGLLAFTLGDHQAYPDTFPLLPFIAVANALAAVFAIAVLARFFAGRRGSRPSAQRPLVAVLSLASLLALTATASGRLAHVQSDGGALLENSRAAAAEVADLHRRYGSVWALNCLHLLALERIENHSRYGHLLHPAVNRRLRNELETAWRGVFRDGTLPAVILISRGGEKQAIPWLYRGYRRATYGSHLAEEHVTVFMRLRDAEKHADALQENAAAATAPR